jgi:hypothetical protein
MILIFENKLFAARQSALALLKFWILLVDHEQLAFTPHDFAIG